MCFIVTEKPAINLAFALKDTSDVKEGWGGDEDGWDW